MLSIFIEGLYFPLKITELALQYVEAKAARIAAVVLFEIESITAAAII